jgi:hypothetical protein
MMCYVPYHANQASAKQAGAILSKGDINQFIKEPILNQRMLIKMIQPSRALTT